MSNTGRLDRVLCFEWARGIAATMVVFLHVMSGITDNYSMEAIGGGRVVVWSIFDLLLTRWAVPVFLMISGALLLDPSKAIDWKTIWRYERRMALVLVTYGYLFCLMEQYVALRIVGPRLFWASLINLLSGKSWAHLWYIYALMGIYLLLPVLKPFAGSATKGDQRTFLVVLFALTIFVPTINDAFGLELCTFVWLPSYVFYFLLGHYAYRWMNMGARTACVCLAFAVAGCAVRVFYVHSGDYGVWVRGPSSLFVCALSLLVFLLFKCWFERPYSPHGVVARLSSYSFGIYVLHPVFLNVAYKALGLGPWSLPPVIFELSMWGFAFFGSIAALLLLRQIPGLRRVL